VTLDTGNEVALSAEGPAHEVRRRAQEALAAGLDRIGWHLAASAIARAPNPLQLQEAARMALADPAWAPVRPLWVPDALRAFQGLVKACEIPPWKPGEQYGSFRDRAQPHLDALSRALSSRARRAPVGGVKAPRARKPAPAVPPHAPEPSTPTRRSAGRR
jgi:hypothetical protein